MIYIDLITKVTIKYQYQSALHKHVSSIFYNINYIFYIVNVVLVFCLYLSEPVWIHLPRDDLVR